MLNDLVACKLVAPRSGLKAQVHAVLARQGVMLPMSDIFAAGGRKALGEPRLGPPFHARVLFPAALIDLFKFEIDVVTKRVTADLKRDRGYRAIQAIPGVGPVLAAVFVAEIGDVTRFPGPQQLCSWAGMTPRHREFDRKVYCGRTTRQGNHLVRAGLPSRPSSVSASDHSRARRQSWSPNGTNISKVGRPRAAHRRLLRPARRPLRCLTTTPAAA